MSDANLGFWNDGADRYSDALEVERNERLAELQRQKAAAASPEEQDRIEGEVEKVQDQYKKKMAELLRLLF